MPDLPTGITFLFTDIESSTKLLQRVGDRYREVIVGHGRILGRTAGVGRRRVRAGSG
jgi:class 3 adenylate cyclase